MDYADLSPHYDVSTLQEVLRALDDETVTRLENNRGVILDGVDTVDMAQLTADDITILQSLAQTGNY